RRGGCSRSCCHRIGRDAEVIRRWSSSSSKVSSSKR
uniref:Uncharacterized protein n=1 Tax=Cucumis melo TaxID=3656 RepID=A0A9I9E339_CUCME